MTQMRSRADWLISTWNRLPGGPWHVREESKHPVVFAGTQPLAICHTQDIAEIVAELPVLLESIKASQEAPPIEEVDHTDEETATTLIAAAKELALVVEQLSPSIRNKSKKLTAAVTVFLDRLEEAGQ